MSGQQLDARAAKMHADPGMREKLLTVRMSAEEWAQMEAVSKRMGLSASQAVRELFRREHEKHFGIERAVAALGVHQPNGATPEEIAGVFTALTGRSCSAVEAQALCEASPDIERVRGKYKLKPGVTIRL